VLNKCEDLGRLFIQSLMTSWFAHLDVAWVPFMGALNPLWRIKPRPDPNVASFDNAAVHDAVRQRRAGAPSLPTAALATG
jgi:hypothetical protein